MGYGYRGVNVLANDRLGVILTPTDGGDSVS
jgi:hypothetical protein